MRPSSLSTLAVALVFALGAVAVFWVGAGFAQTSVVALSLTVLIGAVYLCGALEIFRFRRESEGFAAALGSLGDAPPVLEGWLSAVPVTLRDAVRLRIDGERVALPGLLLTPYLAGLLVMLGMLGTFLGVVLTFKGAVLALEGSADLQAIRQALAGPIKGLAFSFGTSVAGVASSAMLGLMSAISRRERVSVMQLFERQLASVFRSFSVAHRREQTFSALQAQADALPAIATQMQEMLAQIGNRHRESVAQLEAQQKQFHAEAITAYRELAQSVQQSLASGLAQAASAAAAATLPVVESAMASLRAEAAQSHERVAGTVESSLAAASERFEQRGSTLLTALAEAEASSRATHLEAEEQARAGWVKALDTAVHGIQSRWEELAAAGMAGQRALCDVLQQSAQELTERGGQQSERVAQSIEHLLEQSRTHLDAHRAAEQQWIAGQAERMDQLAALWRSELSALRAQEGEHSTASAGRIDALQAAFATQLAALATALEAPIGRLLHTSAEVPQAAAALIAELREDMSQRAERDTLALQERTALLEGTGEFLESARRATAEQRDAIASLVASAGTVLEQVGRQFAEALDAQTARAEGSAAQVSGSAIELSALADAFGHGVELFSSSNERLVDSLQRIETAIGASLSRSDEQLAYYVAQAREVIDLSIGAQKGILEDLRLLHARPSSAGGAPAE